MKQFIISLSIGLLINLLGKNTLIGHFSLFYIQVMILFVIEEIHLRWREYFHYWDDHVSVTDEECMKLYSILTECPRLNYLMNDIYEIGYILNKPEDEPYMFFHSGLYWIVARGYTRSRITELEEDMPRILLYLKNVQNAKAIEAL